MIPWQSQQTHRKTFLAVNHDLATVSASGPRLDHDRFQLTISIILSIFSQNRFLTLCYVTQSDTTRDMEY